MPELRWWRWQRVECRVSSRSSRTWPRTSALSAGSSWTCGSRQAHTAPAKWRETMILAIYIGESQKKKKLLLTPTWFEHATFWSGVRRATVAPRSHSWEKSHRKSIHPEFWSVMANYSSVSNGLPVAVDSNTDTVFAISTCFFDNSTLQCFFNLRYFAI